MIAAALNLDIDYDRMTAELLAVQSKAVAFSYLTDESKETVTAYSLFLRKSSEPTAYSYRGAKSANLDSWTWDYDLNVPYTRIVIGSMPYLKLGAIRVVYFPNVPCMEHTDWDDPDDTTHTLGLSIIPSTGNTHCNVWSEEKQDYVSIPGNAMLLNDSIPHWVPQAAGTRITMRVFGEIDQAWFDNKINHEYCYYR
jgi:hypothetical protein